MRDRSEKEKPGEKMTRESDEGWRDGTFEKYVRWEKGWVSSWHLENKEEGR